MPKWKNWLGGLLAGILVVLAPAVAEAKWLRAESPRFVLYGDLSESEIKAYILKLETFDSTLRVIHGLPDAAPPTKLTVYLVRNHAGLQRVWPTVPERIAGFYIASAEDVFAVATYDRDGDQTLQHEYVHHFMAQNLSSTYSAWVREGVAEYFGTTEIRGQFVEVGKPNQGRANELQYFSWLPLESVLTKGAFEDKNSDGPFYAQSWLMAHYFMSDPGRQKQLQAYLAAVGDGEPPVAAMEKAAGMPLPQLDKTLRGYLRGGMRYAQYTRSGYATPAVSITALGPAEEAVFLEAQQVKSGVPEDERKPLLEKLRALVAKHPGQRLPALTLGHAEISFGDRTAGEALLRKLIEADPRDAEALEFLAKSRRAAGDDDGDIRLAAYRESGALLAQAHKANNRRFQTLYGFAESRRVEPGYPNENTLEVLIVAQKLAPQVSEITLEAARGLMLRKRYDEAVALLEPVANNPHGGGAATAAKSMLRQLEANR